MFFNTTRFFAAQHLAEVFDILSESVAVIFIPSNYAPNPVSGGWTCKIVNGWGEIQGGEPC